jgi:hypothetical protein
LGEADYFPAAGGQAGDGKRGLGNANCFRGRLVTGLDIGGFGYFLPKRCRARIAARFRVILRRLSAMIRCRMAQKLIPFRNFKVLHPHSPHFAQST